MLCVLGVGHEVRREKVAAFLHMGTPHSPPTPPLLILRAGFPFVNSDNP